MSDSNVPRETPEEISDPERVIAELPKHMEVIEGLLEFLEINNVEPESAEFAMLWVAGQSKGLRQASAMDSSGILATAWMVAVQNTSG